MTAIFCFLTAAQLPLPKDYRDMQTVLNAVQAAVQQDPTDRRFGMSRVSLPHQAPISRSTLNGAYHDIKVGYRTGIFARSAKPLPSGQGKLRTSWCMGVIPMGITSSGKRFDYQELDTEVILPAVKKLLSGLEKEMVGTYRTSPGWIYEVASRKIFSTGPSCLNCHQLDRPGAPIAVIGIARTTWPKTKSK
jgi:hypothetical protein